MDLLSGRLEFVPRPLPAQDAPAGALTASGPGWRCCAAGAAGRAGARETPNGWLGCVGAPYAASGGDALGPLLDADAAALAGRLAGIGGEFALARFAARERELVLATDHFGSIPVFYAVDADGLTFGTDFARVGAAVPGTPVDAQALYDYLFFSVVPGNRTIHSGVQRLPPASALVFRDGRVRVARYWNPDFARPARIPADLGAQTFDAISRAVARPAGLADSGCFLSGGLDSSSVAGLAARQAQAPVRAFTIGFDVPDYDESHYARISARHFGLDLREKRIRSADVTACIDRVVGAFPEPFGNASAVSAYLCAQFARDAGVRHLLAGDGGDELFGGNERYQKQSVLNLYGALPTALRRLVVDPLAAASRAAAGPARKLWSYVEQARVPLPDRLFSYNLLVRNDPATVLTPEFLESVDPLAPYEYARAVYGEPAAGDALDRMLYLDWALTLTDNDLPKVRVACDLAGVSAHFPMLDPEVVRLSTRVPTREKLTLRELRRFYKRAFGRFLPPEVIAKRKHGFGVPVGIWINGDPALRERVWSRLRSLGGRGIVRSAFIDELLRLQQTEHAVYYGALMWSLFMLEEWLLAHAAA